MVPPPKPHLGAKVKFVPDYHLSFYGMGIRGLGFRVYRA